MCSLLCQDKTGCSASAGFGSNRLQARLATKKAKPDGQFYLEPSMVTNFMLDIVVEDLPGNEKCSKKFFIIHILNPKYVTSALFVIGDWQMVTFSCAYSKFEFCDDLTMSAALKCFHKNEKSQLNIIPYLQGLYFHQKTPVLLNVCAIIFL